MKLSHGLGEVVTHLGGMRRTRNLMSLHRSHLRHPRDGVKRRRFKNRAHRELQVSRMVDLRM
jgi:hypothetical protein